MRASARAGAVGGGTASAVYEGVVRHRRFEPVEHAERGVSGSREFAGRFQRIVDDRLGIGLDDQAAPHLDQAPQAGLVEGERRVFHGTDSRGRNSAERYGEAAVPGG